MVTRRCDIGKGELKMKRFNITVNGKAYDVTVEETSSGGAVSVPAYSEQTAQSVIPSAQPAPASLISGQTAVKAPMPGNILGIRVSVGDMVSESQPVVLLEAMKMENDVVAPVAGKVVSVNVKKGDSVKTGEVLLVISE
jgi:biotin carboxyl carrier protein